MASQARVQEYLSRHKIGNLFEDLMAKLINDLPEDPYPFLIRSLERKHKMYNPMRKSAGEPIRSRSSPSPDLGRKSSPAAAWATSDMSVAKTRPQSGKPPGGRGKPSVKSSPSAMRKATNLDDLWSGGIKGKSKADRSPTKVGWADTEDNAAYYSSFGYRGPRQVHDTDPLAGEFSVAKERHEKKKVSKTTASYCGKRRPFTQKDAAARRHHDLQKMLMEQRGSPDSGYEEEKPLDPDYADEIMEDPDLLRSEGARNVKRSGVKMSKSYRQRKTVGDDNVRVSICARCANIMTGTALPSQLAQVDVENRNHFGDFPGSDYDSDRDFNRSRPQSVVVSSPGLSDDEFESVSQVTGPRRPVWNNEDSDAEGGSMKLFSARKDTARGKPALSSGSPEQQRHRKGKYETPRTHRTFDVLPLETARSGRDDDNVRSTWQAGTKSSPDSEDEDFFKYNSASARTPRKPPKANSPLTAAKPNEQVTDFENRTDDHDSLAHGGQGWAAPAHDFETDASSVNWREAGKDDTGPY